ncbi:MULTISPECIES: relaxase/mobilization nuclease domain-containing protein [Oscillospiraceae]|uniref:Relaxase/mobilization nuclease domain-containing protein n=1 Tax=Ruthenibacterium lactatiformans TaxID=1550024 RepID=A0A6L6LRV7_9FIRM|nr:relaxase/mobilization nuclease domain-containing protein [Ruthenibacterium lactatiformans]OKZ58231.1 MAG: relaxase [Clostridiales bacterium 45_37]HBE8490847.1 relaxase/mobilization nuclease domain-containing protein [Clostridioides difficile]MTQ79509.1 relaxase/mobilization nuclease domain-containing protein [Ruthenibacterium lactatiformans]MTS27019.1 relaxase/mobilization nuclease domain-containing protein [Ruthenibacterium lactatiformans]MTS29983.1 relaxase/mobilization nuclease domain-co
MATLKHINSKNADYGAAEQYLLFEHDEFTMKPVLDETGRLIPREDYRLSTLNCGGEDFAVACMRANLRYEKNQRREDVKSHHYIISFDPRDGPDNGLTVDRAQELGEKFCAEHFPGHQALVCTHPDGHNHSGNIHVHIVINSLRIEEVPFLPYMDRPADTKAGCKHRCTDAALRYFKSEVMEMCHREGLYQIDLLNGSKNRVTDREYWAQKKGQAALDKQNASMIAGGITPRQTKFETNKEKLRQTIRAALSAATSFENFSSLLLREGVAVKESRGRLSYLTPDRTKPITARKLGDDFDRAAVLAVLEQNAARAAEKATAIPEYPRHGKTGIQPVKAPQSAPKQDGVQRLVDIEQKMAEGKGKGYEHWAKIHNIKQMAKTLNVYQQYGFTSPEQLEAAFDTAYEEMRQTSGELKTLETKLQGKKELQRQVLAYAKTKPARDGLKAQKSPKARAAYRQAHESDFIIADAAARYFKAHGITRLPARKALQDEIEQLVSKKSGLYNTYHEQKQRFKELQTVKRNIDQILRREEPRRRKEQSHER